MKKEKKRGRLIRLVAACLCGTLLTALASAMTAGAAQLPSYRTVTEVFDWGPSVSKIVLNLGRKATDAELDPEAFSVHVRRVLAEGSMTPQAVIAKRRNITLGAEAKSDKDLAGERTVTRAYRSDADGREKKNGDYLTLELAVAPTDTLGAALNFDLNSFLNNWVTARYTVEEPRTKLVVDNAQGDIRPQADRFTYGTMLTGSRGSFPYASYEPRDGKKHPLIVWLHGMGEGGNSPSLPIMGNKAVAFAGEDIQRYFDGAYVFVPQARTYWMHGKTGFGDGTSIYSEDLMEAIRTYVREHPGVDPDRIYVGGDSNGGYMTMLLVRDNPGFFAAAFPTCEGLKDSLITEADLQSLARTPLWFTAAKTDTVLPPDDYAVPTVARLKKAGADVQFSYFDKVADQSGLYKKADGTPYEYPGHWSWIYVYNDACEATIDGRSVKLFDWLAGKRRVSSTEGMR